MEKNKKRTTKQILTKINIAVFFLFAATFALLGHFNAFNKLDYRFYDLLLGLKKEPQKSEKILHVNIDDESIANIGAWPWSRDIIADCLIHMKELGAERAVFDVEYISPSPMGVPTDAEEMIASEFQYSKDQTAKDIQEFSAGVQSGAFQQNEIQQFTNQLLNDYILQTYDNLEQTVLGKAYRDNDEYFGKAVQFFGNTWLTVNTRDVIIETSDDDMKYVQNRLLMDFVKDDKNYIHKNNDFTSKDQYDGLEAGFTPAINKLVSRAQGIGFTNVVIDSDGTRRRIELLHEHDGKYAGQLVFAPLVNLLGVKEIIRNKNSLVLKNAVLPGQTEPEDITIPLDSNGRMLINWLHSDFGKSFKHDSISFLKDLENFETNIDIALQNIQHLEILDNEGNMLSYSKLAQDLCKEYNNILQNKDFLLSKCTGYDMDGNVFNGISSDEYEKYFSARKFYFEKVTEYGMRATSSDAQDSFLSEIENRIMELIEEGDISSEIANAFMENINEQFQLLSASIENYNDYFSSMKNSYEGSFCIIGNTASSTTDQGATPFVRLYPNVGTHANVVNTILQKDFIYPLPWYIGYLVSFITATAVLFITIKFSNKIQNIMNGITVLILIVFSFLLLPCFSAYMPFSSYMTFLVLSYLSGVALRYVISAKEKGFIRKAFSTYVSKDVVDQIVAHPERLSLGGEEKKITALFSDIKSFSSFSELVTPSQLVNILNQYLGAMSDVILDYHGTIDKYIGDSIVSFFGAPVDLQDHAYYACVSALKMKMAESEFNKKHLIDGDIPRELYTRIGINTGKMVAGNMGTTNKMNYTIMGDDVNLASRLEGVNKIYGSWILTSEATWKEIISSQHKDELVARRLDKVRVVGKERPVQLYNIMGFKKDMSRVQLEEIDVFHEGLELYLGKKFADAEKAFKHANELVPSDVAALVFADRCDEYLSKGIPENWDGIKNLTSK